MALTKWKAFADDKINVASLWIIFVSDRVESIVGN